MSGVMIGYSHNSDRGVHLVVKEKSSDIIRLQEYCVFACISISPSITHTMDLEVKVTVGYGVSVKIWNIKIF
jgi:hypothetical protein